MRDQPFTGNDESVGWIWQIWSLEKVAWIVQLFTGTSMIKSYTTKMVFLIDLTTVKGYKKKHFNYLTWKDKGIQKSNLRNSK